MANKLDTVETWQ